MHTVRVMQNTFLAPPSEKNDALRPNPGLATEYCCTQILVIMLFYPIISPLPVFTPEGTIGLPSVRPSVSLSVSLSVRLSVCQSVSLSVR